MQSLSGATPPKDTLMAHAAAIGGGTLHEKMKEHIRCTQPLSGITIAEEDTAPDYCDLPPAFTAPAHPLSAFATATAAAAAAASDVTGMDAAQSPNTATPPRDMLSARRRQRSCSCSGGGGAGDAHTSGGVHILGDVHTFMAHHIPSPKGISCCSEEASGLCGHATVIEFHTSPVHTSSAQATVTPPCIDSSYRRQRLGFSCSGAAPVHTSYVHTAASPLGTATSLLKQFLMEKCASDIAHLIHAEDGAGGGGGGGGGGYKAAEHSSPAPPAPMLPTPPHFPHPPAASRGISSSSSGGGGAALSPRLSHAAVASRGVRGQE